MIKAVCGYHPAAAEIVHSLKEKGYRVALATNPIFPARATQWRIQWTALQPEECLMVGNDVGEDMIEKQLGMRVFLLTDCLTNKTGEDIDQYPHGGFDALEKFLSALQDINGIASAVPFLSHKRC